MKNASFSKKIDKITHIARYFSQKHISSHAAGAGYFIVLSAFPMLVLLLSLLRYTGLEVDTLTKFVGNFLPAALLPAAERLILSTYRNTSGVVVGISAITGLWSASRGIYALLKGLNTIYEVPEDRGYLYIRGISMFYTVLFVMILLATLVLSVFGTTLLAWLPTRNISLLQLLDGLVDMRFLLLLLLQTGLFTAMFMVLPNRRNSLQESVPGALLASVGWLVFSDLYSIYVEHFSRYANIYGSVYAVALSMLWLYCCISIVFCGGALNHYLATQKNQPTKEG